MKDIQTNLNVKSTLNQYNNSNVTQVKDTMQQQNLNLRDFQLEFSPFSFIALNEGIISKQINEHSTARVKGIIHQSNVQKYLDMSIQREHFPFSITAVTDGDERITVFLGVTTIVEIGQVGQVATMTISAKSGSYLMDIKKRFRSFQDPATTHSEVLSLLGEPYADYNYLLKAGREKVMDFPLAQFIVQYRETDWAFAKRLASRLNTALVPADTFPGTRFYFGVPHLERYVLDDSVDYQIVMDSELSDQKTQQGLQGVSEADALCYIIESRDIYALGDLIQLQELPLYVDRIATVLSGQEFMHTYYLRPQVGLRVPQFYNDKLIGASLDGQVLAVQRDKVQVQITGDENAEQNIRQWFPFATPYSSPDGTGWFAMPERGDQVRLYIPDREEAQAVAFNSLHVASEARTNPDIKSMRNKFGKEIRFTPNTLVMTNNAGMEISLIDSEGIRIESDKAIFIKAAGSIDISSGAGLSMLADDSVVVQRGGTSLVVDDNIAFVGGKLKMQ